MAPRLPREHRRDNMDPMGTARGQHLVDRVARAVAGAAGRGQDLESLAASVCAVVAGRIPFTFGCFATLDPTSGLVGHAYKTRSLGVGDEEFAALEYGAPDLNRFAEIAQRKPPVGILSVDTGGQPESCRRYRDFLFPRFGFTDELRVTFNSRAATWGALAIYRGVGDPCFTPDEGRELAAASSLVASAIQGTLFGHQGDRDSPAATAVQSPDPTGPAIVILDSHDRVTHLSPAARVALDDLGGWEHGSLPTSVLAVTASARQDEDGCATKIQGRSGRWLHLRSAPLDGAEGRGAVVVSIEAATGSDISRLALVARGLTAREEDVAMLVLQGASTRAIASLLYLSPHTVQDHLKAVFAKLGVNSRREMIAQLLLARHSATAPEVAELQHGAT